ncbi:MAG: response regulator transcription factor [Lachnospiraceae bacterium]|nr:response regulator transcription factor [Lachnospiraceae bacterium]
MRVLIVEDENDLNRVITKKLKAEGYSVDSCFNGEEALEYIRAAEYDIIIMDIMMPKMNGYDALKQMRQNKVTTPVLFLTAKDAIEDRVKGLDLGADDYLVKPFAFDELMARLRVMVRRKHGTVTNEVRIADLTIESDSHLVKRGEKKITLTAKEYSILEYLVQNAGMVLSRDKIESHVWDYDYQGASNMIDVYIRNLRRKLDDGYETKLIQTVRGVGYVLREERKIE